MCLKAWGSRCSCRQRDRYVSLAAISMAPARMLLDPSMMHSSIMNDKESSMSLLPVSVTLAGERSFVFWNIHTLIMQDVVEKHLQIIVIAAALHCQDILICNSSVWQRSWHTSPAIAEVTSISTVADARVCQEMCTLDMDLDMDRAEGPLCSAHLMLIYEMGVVRNGSDVKGRQLRQSTVRHWSLIQACSLATHTPCEHAADISHTLDAILNEHSSGVHIRRRAHRCAVTLRDEMGALSGKRASQDH